MLVKQDNVTTVACISASFQTIGGCFIMDYKTKGDLHDVVQSVVAPHAVICSLDAVVAD